MVQGQPWDQVQGNPHSTVISLRRQHYGWPPSWTNQRRPLLLKNIGDRPRLSATAAKTKTKSKVDALIQGDRQITC
jgi:hypothetical protein